MNVHRITSISNINSGNFFDEICVSLNRAIEANFVFIATIDDANILVSLDFDYIQGYYFSNPLKPELLPQYLTDFQYGE